MEARFVLIVLLVAITQSSAREDERARPRLRLRHGPNKELILQRDLEAEEEEEDGLSVRKRCECYCHSKVYHNDWDCCACPWTDEICFPGDVFLTLQDGTRVQMRDLRTGDKIQTVSGEGEVIYSEVKTFLKRQPTKHALYLTISTSTGYFLTLSGRHVVFVSNSNDSTKMEPRFALTVKQGEYLFTRGDCGQCLCPAMVTSIEPIVKEGVYVPLTDEGTLIVNDVMASCYSSINHHVAHVFTTPFRWFPWLLSAWQEDGYSPLVDGLKQFGHFILPDDLQFQDSDTSVLPRVRIDF